MNLRHHIIVILLLSIIAIQVAAQQPFNCTGEPLTSSYFGNRTIIYRPLYIPFSNPFFSPVAVYDDINVDAIGFNAKDNLIYGVEQNSNNILKLGSDGIFIRIGKVTVVDTLNVNAGDCSPDGLYVCYDFKLKQMLVFDVNGGLKLLRRINLFWDPKSPNKGAFNTRIFDFAYDPNDPTTAYSHQGTFEHPDLKPTETQGALLKINLNLDDPNVGMVTPLAKVNRISHISGLSFSPKSNLFGFGGSGDELIPDQNTFFSLNGSSGQLFPILTNFPAATLSDACSCAFSLTFTNDIPREGMFCSNDLKTFVITIENNSFLPLSDLILKDTFPEGTIISGISNTFKGNIDIGTGIGYNILSISSFLIPPKTSFEIRIELKSVDAKDGFTSNQAFLQKLPPQFPANFGSDNPGTTGLLGDASRFYIITRKISKLSWEVTQATNCLTPNDGKVAFTSPDFMEGEGYEVRLRNEKDWKESILQVAVDDKKTFVIDSLYPGAYQLFGFRSLRDNCSVSLQDTLIILDPPNNLLDLKVSSNSPVCEGQALRLTSEMSPQGTIGWRGPDIFGSEDINPIVQNATPAKSGTYKATAQYGYCIQIKEFDVAVKPQFKITLVGASNYCLRDTIRFDTEGSSKGDTLSYVWSGPSTSSQFDSIFLTYISNENQAGTYQLISTNGACFDTVTKEIIILPTPSLSMSEWINTDFCSEIILSSNLTGDTDVNYQWTPSESLSCDNCPSPKVQHIVQSNYQLKVINQYNCADSATTKIVLDKSKIAFAPNILNTKSATMGNRLFKLYPNCVVQRIHSLSIFDRFGNNVFNTKSDAPSGFIESWDGLKNGAIPLNGVYIWTAKIELVDGTIVYLHGDVTLL